MKVLLFICAVAVALAVSGCVHREESSRLHEYKVIKYPNPQIEEQIEACPLKIKNADAVIYDLEEFRVQQGKTEEDTYILIKARSIQFFNDNVQFSSVKNPNPLNYPKMPKTFLDILFKSPEFKSELRKAYYKAITGSK